MRKVLSMVILSVLILVAASPKMRIGYYGHAFFEVVLPNGVRIVMDPFDPTHVPNPIGLDFPTGVEADVVVITHTHFDHCYWQGIGGSPDVFISTSGSTNGIDITAHPTKHRLTGQEGENHIMTWEWGDLKFAHMGGYWDIFSLEDSTVLAGSDFVIFILWTVGASTPFIDKILPSVAFPNHYFTPDHNPYYEDVLLTLEEYNESLDYPIVSFDDAWIAVDIDNLPESTVIWEPAYSADLPGDLEVTAVDATESPPYMIGVNVVNNTPRDADDAALILNVLDGVDVVHADTALVSIPGDDEGFHEFGPWMPPESKEYTLFAEVVYPADEVPPNDTVSVTVHLSGITETRSTGPLQLDIRWLEEGVLLIECCGTDTDLTIYDANGRLVDILDINKYSEGAIRYRPDLSQGVYFIRLSTSQGSVTRKFTILR